MAEWPHGTDAPKNFNPAYLEFLRKRRDDTARAWLKHKSRANSLIALSTMFLLLLLIGLVAGFTLPLGNGAIGMNILFALFFIVSAFFAGLWVFKGWDDDVEEEAEEAEDNYNSYLSNTADTRFEPQPTTPRKHGAK